MRGKPAANENVTLRLQEAIGRGMPEVHFDYKTTTDEKGHFVFERVVPGDGQVASVAVNQLAGGMSSWTPTHVTKATFAPGQTTRVLVGGDGRQVLGRLVLPATVTSTIDWRLAMISLQSQPKNLLPMPKPPFPPGIDPHRAFAFEDLPPGNYRLTVQAFAESPRHPGMHGDVIATLEHSFEVPKSPGGDLSQPIDLGELTLNRLENQSAQP